MITLIINPGARGGKSREKQRFWACELRNRGIDATVVETKRLGDAREAARVRAAKGIVVACGGDGTINEVLDGLMLSGCLEARLGVLYSGTSPDFCRFHGIPLDPAEALDALLDGTDHTVDVVRMSHTDGDGQSRISHFGCSCNIGLGADIARVANRLRPALGDTLGTGMAAVRALVLARPADMEISVDGDALPVSRVNHVVIAKNPFLASGLNLALDLRPGDGRIAVVAVHGRSRAGLFRLLPCFYTGNAVTSPGVVCRYGREVSVRPSGVLEVEFDGDPHGFTPVEATVLPGALRLIGGHDD